MKIGEILNTVYDADVGWRPASGAIKPVHVANGLVRAVQGVRYDTRRLHEFVVWWKRGQQPDEERTFEALLKAQPQFYGGFGAEFDRSRRYARGLLGGDGALFPSVDHSSFSLTNALMVTPDNMDWQLGLFAAGLMGDPAEPSTLSAAVRDASCPDAPRDPLTALVWPLLDDGEPKEVLQGTHALRVKKALGRRHNAGFVAAMSEAAQCLATHERAQGNQMRTLQRAVQFACVATVAHAQALAAGGRMSKRPPALMTLAGHRSSDVAVASERSLDLVLRRFEEWLAVRLGGLINKGVPLSEGEDPFPTDTTDLRSIRPLLAKIAPAKRGDPTPSDALIRERVHYYKRARTLLGDEAEPAQVLARGLVDAYSREFASSGGPKKFLRGIGCKIGLLYPHFAGRTREKRYRPSVPVLDMLVRACVPTGETVALPVFLERLWERFGLVVGGRRDDSWDDAAFLAHHDLPVDTSTLVENCERLVDELVAMGLARRYADDVTFVGDGRE